MNVTIQFIVQVEVTLILQVRSACGALETLNMEILILNSHKNTNNEALAIGTNVLPSGQATVVVTDRSVNWSVYVFRDCL